MPTIIFNKNHYTGDNYRLSPSGQSINNRSCTNISFKLHSKYENTKGYFTLYPENSCQSLGSSLSLDIFILPCPLGFELSEDHQWQCFCNSKLLKFTQKCYIHKPSARIERTKNNFWISQVNNNTLIIHESHCPLDYCKDTVEM